MAKADSSAGRYAYTGLDRVIHEKARLGILTSLLTRPDGLPFNDLKASCALTDGNLSRHLTILQEADLIAVVKSSGGKRPQTRVTITDLGRRRFREYLAVLETVLRDAVPAPETDRSPSHRFKPA